MGEPNPAGPGVRRLADHAKAMSPVEEKGPAMMVVWEQVKTSADHALIRDIQANYERRSRPMRRRYERAVRRAMRRGFLVPANAEENLLPEKESA